MAERASASFTDVEVEVEVEGIDKETLDSLVYQAMQKEILRRLSKAKWVAFSRLMRTLCIHKGIIYGGAVRSYIQRTYAAQAYYSYCEKENIDADANYICKEVHTESYNDRVLFPADVDVFISESDLNKFMETNSGNKDYHLKKIGSSRAKYFFESNDLFKKALTLQKYETGFIHFCNSVLSGIVFPEVGADFFKLNIDFVVIKDEYTSAKYNTTLLHTNILYPPFGNPDFDVNLLCFKVDDTAKEFTISPLPILKRLLSKRANTLQDTIPLLVFKPLDGYDLEKSILEGIIKGICEKRARPTYPIPDEYCAVFGTNKSIAINDHRIAKILKKGFTIDKFGLIVSPELRDKIMWAPDDYLYVVSADADTQEKCVICLEVFTRENPWFKGCITCNGKMHQTCQSKYLTNLSTRDDVNIVICPQCRTHIPEEKCPCKFITFFNVIDYVSKQTCTYCSKAYSKKDGCSCHIINCICKRRVADAPPSMWEGFN